MPRRVQLAGIGGRKGMLVLPLGCAGVLCVPRNASYSQRKIDGYDIKATGDARESVTIATELGGVNNSTSPVTRGRVAPGRSEREAH